MTRVNYERFFDNRSSEDSLLEFVEGEITQKEFLSYLWDPECQKEAKKLLKGGVKKARRNAAVALKRRGYMKPY